MLGWSLLGRLPLGMTPLALLFLIRGEGRSYAAAGIVVALYAVAVGVGAPIAGRQVDRFGPTPVLRIRAVAYALLAGTVVTLAVLDAGIVPVAAAAALGGLALPPLSSTVRIVWPRLAPNELRSTAYALEASLQEVFFVGGPLLAAALATVSPAAGLAGAGLASLVGATATALLPPVRETPPSRAGGAGLLGALGSPGVRTVVLYAATVGVGFGSVELAMPAFAEAHGSRELGGLALASFSGGSLVGGLVAGMRPPRSVLRRFVLGSLVLAAALLGLLLAVSIPTLCLLAFLAGLPIAPTIGALYALIDRSARAGHGCGVVRLVRHGRLDRHRHRLGARRHAHRRARRPRGVRRRRGHRLLRRPARLGSPRDAAADCLQSRASVYAAHRAPVAQGTERRTSNPRVGGSNPPGRIVPA